jgi:two-component system, NtrC family, sensor kinase
MADVVGNTEKIAKKEGRSLSLTSQRNTLENFARLRLRLKLGFLAAFFVPLGALYSYFHFQFNSTLKETGKLHLASLAESQGNTIDLFLQERVANLFGLFHGSEFSTQPSQQDMDRHLRQLRQTSDAFIDVGVCDPGGVQIGYAGPFQYLRGKDYGGEDWFLSVIEQEPVYHISDIYLGFRDKPHFTIAVKQVIDENACIVRATLDPDKFFTFLRNISRGYGVDSALVNREGYYQVVDPHRGELLGRSEYMPPGTEGYGAEEVTTNGNSTLVAHIWLKETPWVLIVRQPLGVAYADMYRARKIIMASIALIVAVLGFLTWMTTDRLLKRAQATAEAREELQSELIHASKLASLGELAAGIAHEINNPLAIIGATNGVIRDLFDPQFDLEWSPETIREELSHIDSAVSRAREITQKLLDFARKSPQRLAFTNVNQILDNVVSGLKEREFHVSNITLVRDYDLYLPEVKLDPDQITQVFLNLINNAGDAIDGPGTITLCTRRDGASIRVTITDTGSGMTSDVVQNLFLPFYTTKEVGKGTGLGLSISLTIVESIGGRIEVQSMPGAGSVFTVVLPITESEQGGNE